MTIKLIDVPGIGPKTAEYLEAEGITSAEQLLQAGIYALLKAPGFHEKRATTVLDAAGVLKGEGKAGTGISNSGSQTDKSAKPETKKVKDKKGKKKKDKKQKKHKDKGGKKKKDKNKKKKKKS